MASTKHKPVWKFKKVVPGDMYVDPTHDEFFTTQDVGGINNALVRETIQNSLDARDPEHIGPIIVRYSFSKVDQIDKVKNLVDGLIPHVKASKNGDIIVPDLKESISTLIIEDFGTIGLEGDPDELWPDSEDDKKHNFYYFWRNIGRSDKSKSDRGRWGLGKAVFPVVSSARSFFGLTVRKSDKATYLMGQSLLKIHALQNGSRYMPYGHYGFCTHEKYQDFVLPIKNPEMIIEFSNLFSIHRKEEAGLSIVVPFLRSGISAGAVAQSVLEQFFYPILSGELEVWIEDGEETCEISSKSIEQVAQDLVAIDSIKMDIDAFLRLLAFTKWVLHESEKSEVIPIGKQDWTKAPSWKSELLDDNQLLEIKGRFDAGERLMFKVPTKVHHKGSDPKIAYFNVFLERDDELSKPEDHFIRGGLKIPGIRSLRNRGVRGMAIIDKDPLTSMLGDSENPAHTEWQRDARGFKEKYVHSFSCLYFVINSVRNLANFVLSAGNDTDPILLEDFFSLSITDSEKKAGGHSGDEGKGGGQTESPSIDVEPIQKPVRIGQYEDGFYVRSTGKGESLKSIEILVAYDVVRGNPFMRHTREDFNLHDSGFKINCTGISDLQIQENSISFLPSSPKFGIVVRGFDKNRDLAVDVKWVEAET